MRVAMYYNNRDVRLEKMPTPRIGSGEILVRVQASGVCGSDVMEWYRVPKAPIVLGHEIAGEVTAVGDGVKYFKVGDRVFATHHVPCNTCYHCLRGNHSACETLRSTHFDPGGFAEYIRVPAINVDRGVFKLPDEVSFEDGSFIEPLGCAIRGQRLARFQTGSSVLIIGSGITGLLHIQLACAQGAGRVIATDINEYRLKAALRLGADAVIHANEDVPKRLCEVNDGRLADLVIVCTGSPHAIEQSFNLVERGGSILFFAPTDPGIKIPMPFNEIWWAGITMTSSYAASPSDLAIAIELIRSRRVNVKDMITHRLPLAETGRGFQLVAEAKDSIKVIIEPQK
ncbi:MAG: theronine dehydrogenase-like protein Zn-dependent dehydrogenase [Candidatus Dadabacteria bacterium CSP1-2]|nr:MAG: theronine dehydrogenase-like protein Zn-dependent dehydrogenase [Candidatus Dadabacteria bacterium CSP1-2]